MSVTFLIFFTQFVAVVSALNVYNYTLCKKETFKSDSFVCTCTESYCDAFDSSPIPLNRSSYAVYTSSKDAQRQQRLHLNVGKISDHPQGDAIILNVNRNVQYQEVIGFGGAFTDAATINIQNLSPKLQDYLLNSYYSPNGIEYNIGRIPMASCDFSTRIYTYADTPGDFNLTGFKLAPEDMNFKIPIIKKALARSEKVLKLFGSPWSAPGWMKTSNSTLGGTLLGQAGNKYHKTWAQYFVKFLDSYKANGIKLWGITVENEPIAGYIPGYSFQCMGFTGTTERDFIKEDLGPALHDAHFDDVKLMIFDDSRLTLPVFPSTILEDKNASRFVSGVAVHWYEDSFIPPSVLTNLHKKFPDYFILASEACTGAENVVETRGPVLGDWSRGERYSHSIIQDFQHWVGGWTDWNLALNMQGGPNWVKNYVDSPIIVNNEVFYKQPMFYHLGHFSKFVLPGSFRIGLEAGVATELEFLAFLRPDGSIVVVVLNRDTKDFEITIKIDDSVFINANIKGSSIQTYLWGGKDDKSTLV